VKKGGFAMKKKIVLSVALVLTAVVFMTMLTGCEWLFGKPEETGLKIGFKTPRYNGIVIGIESENTEFDMDDITLNFYYGLWRTKLYEPSDDESYEAFIAVYFIKGGYQDNLKSTFDDYRDIEGFYYMKNIPLEEFNSDAYKINSPRTPSKYAHSEQITIPKEFIESLDRNIFYFTVQIVVFDKEENKYKFSYQTTNEDDKINTLWIEYKVLENNKKQLSDR
jgi:hypothetical protein